MRVIAGEAKGRRLVRTKGEEVRPMTDRVRSAMFSTLGERVVGARVLDLFSGSGSVGIEALSRGAVSVTFVERDPKAVQTIRENLNATGLGARADVVQSGVEEFLERKMAERFDLIFIDPPFREGLAPRVLELIEQNGASGEETLAVAQVPTRGPQLEVGAPWRTTHQKRYGDSVLIYLKMEAE